MSAARTSTPRKYFKGWRLGCLWLSVVVCGFCAVIVAIVVGILVLFAISPGRTSTSMPAFLSDTATPSSTRVHAHRESGLVVYFYSSSDSFEVTRQHYRRSLEDHGSQFDTLLLTDSSTADRYNKYGRQAVDECATVSVFTGLERHIINRRADIERLRSYPNAYVVTYGHPCGS